MQNEEKQQLTEPTVSEYQGKPVISLPIEGSNFGFTFGKKKAKAILKYIDEIKKFAE